MGSHPCYFKGPQNPVEQVSWNHAVEFCRKLSSLPEEKATGYVYRLPTEAEWEYACWVGTQTAYSFGDSDSELADYAWYGPNSGGTTHPVGSKKPNPWGLYDMHGNIWEWCQDRHGKYPERLSDGSDWCCIGLEPGHVAFPPSPGEPGRLLGLQLRPLPFGVPLLGPA